MYGEAHRTSQDMSDKVLDGAAARTAPTKAKAKAKVKASRTWWRVHQWAGLKLCLFMSFILLTGTLATVSNEIDWLITPGARVDPGTVSGATNWPAIAEQAAAAVPGYSVTGIFAPIDPWWAASVSVVDGEGRRRLLLAHPATGTIQDSRSVITAQLILRRMHRHLFLPNWIGVPLVSALAIPLGISLVTSFVVYKRWWRGFFKPLRFRDARTWTGDFHRLAGVWTLWFTALMVVTSLWYLIESLGGHAAPAPRAEVAPLARPAPDVAASLDMSFSAARQARPDLRIDRIFFPSESSGAFIFQGQREAILVRPRANAVWTDAATGEVKLIADGTDFTVHQRISEMADPLHFGTFGGIWTKLIWFVFGALLTGLSISGAAIYALRIMKSRRESPSFADTAALSIAGMGRWAWFSSLLLFLCAVFFGLTLSQLL